MGQDAADDLDVIRIDHPNNVKECCSRMFSEWRQRNTKASYKDLIDGLKEVNLIQLASEVEKLLIPSVESCVEEKSEIPLNKGQNSKLEKPRSHLGGNHHNSKTQFVIVLRSNSLTKVIFQCSRMILLSIGLESINQSVIQSVQ